MKNKISHPLIFSLVFCLAGLCSNTGRAQAQLRATVVSYQQVNLSWDRLPGIPEVYVVERKEDGPGQNFVAISSTLPGSTFAYQDKTVQENRTYIYRVIASCDKSCGGTLNEVKVTTPLAPPANPSNLDVFFISGRGLTVTWQGNNSDGTSFLLERSENGGGFGLIANVPYARVLSYLDRSTTPGNRYCYRVKARNTGGESGYSNEGCVSLAQPKPAAPSGLSASVGNARQVNLAWTDNAGNETGFDIERSQDGTGFTKIGQAGANAASFQDNEVSPKTKYWYRLVAKNEGGFSEYSNIADVTTPDVTPDAPRNLNATPVSNTQINLSWSDISGPFGNETAYELERSTDGNAFNKIADLPADVTSYQNTGLATLTRYWYRLKAKNALGYSAYSNVADATTFDLPPTAPSTLAARTISSSQIDLSWKDNSANETSFEIERSVNGTTFEKIGETGANGISFQSTGLSPATRYWFRVRAKNSVNPSAYTNVADATTKDIAPNRPRSLTAMVVSYQQISLAWADVSGNETGFEIEISTDGTNFSKLGTTAANVDKFESKGLKQLTTYYYRVRATNAIGNSAYSEIANATTPKAPIPDKPIVLSATPVDFDLIVLKWAALSSNATTVIIERSRKPDADFAQVGSQPATTTQFPDREILDVYDYYYRIKAANSAGASPYSEVVKVPAGAIITAVEPAWQQGLIYVHDKILHIALNRSLSGRLVLFNTRGIAVKTMPLSQNMVVDLSLLPAGVYIAVLDGEKTLVKQKVLLY
ncbi:fibronectin type III domain-containing protein [Dyadobacter pollutisoli]|uniref:Fibronectin type III domain-containing protein n=1 Tax=Dyadobacter pollutisoli TaxID=2910158 RepID=A0A9E8SMB3_9BACT|nr:fibronectin type III domain-containing protein [Dyadobacter pollutisoli]WAC13139.1 fibronectin type III domain-containing protein [Dyadobacter pollutisoli]